MRADVAADDGSAPVSVLVNATETSPIPDVDDFTEFYPTNRPHAPSATCAMSEHFPKALLNPMSVPRLSKSCTRRDHILSWMASERVPRL